MHRFLELRIACFACAFWTCVAGAQVHSQTKSEERVVALVAEWAQLSPTFSDFVNMAARSHINIAELSDALKQSDLWQTRLPPLYASGDRFVFDVGEEESLQFVAQPKPHLLFAHRFINLENRTLPQVARDLGDALAASYHAKAPNPWEWVMIPRASAQSASNRMMAGATAGILAAGVFQKPGPELDDDVSAIQNALASSHQKFKIQCVSVAGEKALSAKVTLPSEIFFRTWIVKHTTGDGSFELDNLYNDEPSTSDCHYKFTATSISRKPVGCGAGTIKTAKGSPAVVAQMLVPGVPLARIARCCTNVPGCEQKLQASPSSGAPGTSGGSGLAR